MLSKNRSTTLATGIAAAIMALAHSAAALNYCNDSITGGGTTHLSWSVSCPDDSVAGPGGLIDYIFITDDLEKFIHQGPSSPGMTAMSNDLSLAGIAIPDTQPARVVITLNSERFSIFSGPDWDPRYERIDRKTFSYDVAGLRFLADAPFIPIPAPRYAPEPSTASLLALGLVGIAAGRRRRAA